MADPKGAEDDQVQDEECPAAPLLPGPVAGLGGAPLVERSDAASPLTERLGDGVPAC